MRHTQGHYILYKVINVGYYIITICLRNTNTRVIHTLSYDHTKLYIIKQIYFYNNNIFIGLYQSSFTIRVSLPSISLPTTDSVQHNSLALNNIRVLRPTNLYANLYYGR